MKPPIALSMCTAFVLTVACGAGDSESGTANLASTQGVAGAARHHDDIDAGHEHEHGVEAAEDHEDHHADGGREPGEDHHDGLDDDHRGVPNPGAGENEHEDGGHLVGEHEDHHGDGGREPGEDVDHEDGGEHHRGRDGGHGDNGGGHGGPGPS